MLDGGAVGAEANDTGTDGAEGAGSVAGGDVSAPAVSVGGVDPTVNAPAGVVDDGVCVADTEPGVKDLAAIGFAVAVGVAEEENIGSGGDNHSVVVEDKTGDEFDAVGEDVFSVVMAVIFG